MCTFLHFTLQILVLNDSLYYSVKTGNSSLHNFFFQCMHNWPHKEIHAANKTHWSWVLKTQHLLTQFQYRKSFDQSRAFSTGYSIGTTEMCMVDCLLFFLFFLWRAWNTREQRQRTLINLDIEKALHLTISLTGRFLFYLDSVQQSHWASRNVEQMFLIQWCIEEGLLLNWTLEYEVYT